MPTTTNVAKPLIKLSLQVYSINSTVQFWQCQYWHEKEIAELLRNAANNAETGI